MGKTIYTVEGWFKIETNNQEHAENIQENASCLFQESIAGNGKYGVTLHETKADYPEETPVGGGE